MKTERPTETDVLVVGAGPAGSAAAAWAARAGLDVVLADSAVFPRDKSCGDGLTPRAIAELDRLGIGDWVREHTVNIGLRAHGFGQTLLLPWPGGALPAHGSAVPRTELDDHVRTAALEAGAVGLDGARAVDVRREGGRVTSVLFGRGEDRFEIACRRLVVADGVRSPLGKLLGREWHRDTVYGVAGRAYVASGQADDPWISSHLELRGESGEILSGYGWIFPLGGDEVNIGVGTLATAKRPAEVALRPLMQYYADQRREDFELSGELRAPTSALLPMGGAVSNVAGPNWMLIGDAAACVNPLNGEGIDYGLETGRMAAELLVDSAGGVGATAYDEAWPALLREHYGESFSIARRLAGLVTVPRLLPALGPAGMRSTWLMTLALRWMGNLVTEEDRDAAARIWRWAGRRSVTVDARPPLRLSRRLRTIPMDLLYRAANLAGRAVLGGLGVDVRVHGAQRIPSRGPVLLASTHNSFLDFVVLEKAAVSQRRYLRFLTRYDAWVNPPIAFAMDRMRHVPVDRAAPAGAYLVARRLLGEGEAVGVFPEAGISHAFTVRALMPGVAALAAETGALVVPVAMWGAQRISTVGNPTTPPPDLTRGRVVDVSVGTPFAIPAGADARAWTGYLGEVLTGLLEEIQQLPHHRPRPGEVAETYPRHLGGRAPDVTQARLLDDVPFSAVRPAWGPAPAGAPGRGTYAASAPGPARRSGRRSG